MDIFIPIIICVIFFILFSICGWCCKRKREGTVYGFGGGTNVHVSSQPISASPVLVPPYPITPGHPTPHAGAPAPGFATHNVPYPRHTSYPTTVPVYYPPPFGPTPYPPTTTPYPPAGPISMAPYPSTTGAPYHPVPYMTDHTAQPPSYSEAVSQPPIQPPPPPVKEGYTKQSPYNPNF